MLSKKIVRIWIQLALVMFGCVEFSYAQKVCVPLPCAKEPAFNRSFADALYIYIGTFEVVASNQNTTRTGNENKVSSFINFRPIRVVREEGAMSEVVISKIAIPAKWQSKAHRITDRGAVAPDDKQLTGWIAYLRSLSKKDFLSFDEVASELSHNLESEPERFVDIAVLHVAVGAHLTYRETDVPIVGNQKYAVFVFRGLAELRSESIELFPWEFDVYPVEFFEKFKPNR